MQMHTAQSHTVEQSVVSWMFGNALSTKTLIRSVIVRASDTLFHRETNKYFFWIMFTYYNIE